jgi:hypothetical protein
MAVALWQAEFRLFRPLIERMIAQTERHVLHGEAVAAKERIVGLFEPLIVKGGQAALIPAPLRRGVDRQDLANVTRHMRCG